MTYVINAYNKHKRIRMISFKYPIKQTKILDINMSHVIIVKHNPSGESGSNVLLAMISMSVKVIIIYNIQYIDCYDKNLQLR